MSFKSFDFECPKCLRRELNRLVQEGEDVQCQCGQMMNRMANIVKSYSWGAGDNSSSVTPKKFRREGQK